MQHRWSPRHGRPNRSAGGPLCRIALAIGIAVVAVSLTFPFALLLLRLGVLPPLPIKVIHGPIVISGQSETVYYNGKSGRTFYIVWIAKRPHTYYELVGVEVPRTSRSIGPRTCRLVIRLPISARCVPPPGTP